MEEGNVKELAAFRLGRARSNIEIAKSLMNSQNYGFALNRAYYSVFDAMRAVNALDGFDSSKHSGVIAHFNQEYVKTGKFPPESSAIIRRASMLREKSDYEDFYEPQKEEAEETVKQAEAFIKDIEQYLKGNGIM